MSVKPARPPGASPAPLIKNSAAAPFIHFDNVPVMGTYQGNIEVELAGRTLMPKPDGSVFAELNCTGHLRCSPTAAQMLIEALEKALEMHARQAADAIKVAAQPHLDS